MANPFSTPTLSFHIYKMMSIFVPISKSWLHNLPVFIVYGRIAVSHANSPGACSQINDAQRIQLSESSVFKCSPCCASLYKWQCHNMKRMHLHNKLGKTEVKLQIHSFQVAQWVIWGNTVGCLMFLCITWETLLCSKSLNFSVFLFLLKYAAI